MNYILLADSGSTKTHWCLMADGKPMSDVRTKGLNPFQMSGDEIALTLQQELLPALPTADVDSVYFYGAGCTPEKQPLVADTLRRVLTINGVCEVRSDMLAAARAICGHAPGIACILGTGSNSCAFDGQEITMNVPALGFILGDEGSGAVLGRMLVGNVLKRQLPAAVCERFLSQYATTQADIIERVYRQPQPNKYLASFAPFLKENIGVPEVEAIVKEGFRAFLRRNVAQYPGYHSLPIGFNGGIAEAFEEQLTTVLAEEGMHLGRIIQEPMEGLVEYHQEMIER